MGVVYVLLSCTGGSYRIAVNFTLHDMMVWGGYRHVLLLCVV